MSFRRIQWLAVLLPALSVGSFEFLRHQWLEHMLPGWLGNVVSALVAAAVVSGFVRVFVGISHKLALEVAQSREEAAVVVERQRIAREMHDNVAQALFYLTVKLREVDGLVVAGASGRAHSELLTAEGYLKDTYRQARTVIADLKQQSELENFGESVRRTASEVAERLGLRVACEVEGEVLLPASSRKHLLAIVQEALTNSHRHGRARHATVRVNAIGKDVAVEVLDDGTGFDPGSTPREGSYGHAIMEERARMVGGKLRLDSAPGRGTRVTVHLPGMVS